jgi:hypothetical protein
MSRLLKIAAILLLSVSKGFAASGNPVVASGYAETSRGRLLLKEALTAVNSILLSSFPYQVIGSWEPDPEDAGRPKVLRVYLVQSSKRNFVIQVPFRSCNCIFLQEEAFRENLSRYSTKLRQMMKIDERHMLAFMILHEVGHVEMGHPGHFDDDPSTYNYADTEQKQKERAADEFAVKALIAAADNKKAFSGFMSSMNVQLAITKASWNLMALRLLDGFGGSVLCSKFLFADKGASHPNYELRVLTVNDIIAKTTESGELLRAFEACRAPSAKEPLYPRQ